MDDKKVKTEKGKVESGKDLDDVYFLKIGKVRYLKSKSYKKNCCQICGKKRKTTAHHLIPKRLKCICPHIAEVRVRVCSECDEGFHPENKFIKESDIVRRQSKNISNLKEAIQWRDAKIRSLIKGIKDMGDKATLLLGLKDEDFYVGKNKKTIEKHINMKGVGDEIERAPFSKAEKEVNKNGK